MTDSQPSVRAAIPEGLRHVRTTARFTDDTCPRALLSEHHIAAGVWGRILVQAGALRFSLDDGSGHSELVEAGGSVVIPPLVLHHVAFDGATEFSIEFYR